MKTSTKSDLDPPVAVALRAVVADGVAQMHADEALVAASTDAEHLHQLRVGLRRLRSALALFKRSAPAPARLREDLRWSARQLGLARDVEVLAQDTLARVPVPANLVGEWAALRKAATAAAAAARKRAVESLSGPRHLRWPRSLLAWANSLPDAGELRRDEAMQDASAALAQAAPHETPERRLRRLRKRLIDSGRQLPGPDAAARHRVRIAAKKLRYATEILDPGNRRLSSLVSLQHELGLLNDAEVAAALLHRLAAGAPALGSAAGYAQGWLAADAQQRVSRLGRLWKRARREL